MIDHMKYAVVIEQGPESFGAYVPDLPGCVSVGSTREEALELIREAIAMHIDNLHDSGEPVPNPSSSVEIIEVAA